MTFEGLLLFSPALLIHACFAVGWISFLYGVVLQSTRVCERTFNVAVASAPLKSQ